jgi:hypothetical protein
MLSRLLFSSVLFSIVLSAAAAETPGGESSSASTPPAAGATAQPTQRQLEQQRAMYERRRAELEGKLKVEQVLLKGAGEKGVEIEISYRIVDAEGYAAHPKTTFIADETAANVIPLTKLAKLFNPLPAEEAMKLPPATLTIWDKQGIIKPGQPVTVVVAGYGQKHLIPVAGPGYDPKAVAGVKTQKRNPELAAADAKLSVYEIKAVADGHLLKVRYSSHGIKELDAAEDMTYIENPETGKRHPVAKVPRIGALAPKDIENVAGTYMVIDNAGVAIKPGQRVNVVVSGVKAENILVVEE